MINESKPPVTMAVGRARLALRRLVGDALAVAALGAVIALLWWFGGVT